MKSFTFRKALFVSMATFGWLSLGWLQQKQSHGQTLDSQRDRLIKEAQLLLDSAIVQKRYYFRIRQAYISYVEAARIYEKLQYWGKAANTYHELALTFIRTHSRAQVPAIIDSAFKYYEITSKLAQEFPDSTRDITHQLLKYKADVLNNEEKYADADQLYKNAMQHWYKTDKKDSIFPQSLFYKTYYLHYKLNDFNKSIHCIDSFEKFGNPSNVNFSYALNALRSDYYYALGNYEKSLYHAKIRLEKCLEYFGKTHKYAISSYKLLASCYEQLQDRNEAQQMLLEAYAQLKKSTDHFRVHDILYDISSLHFRNQDYALAKKYFLLSEKFVNSVPLTSLLATYQRAPLIYHYLNKPDSALLYVGELEEILAQVSAQKDRRSLINTSAAYTSLSSYYELVQNPEMAKVLALKSLNAIIEIEGRNSAKSDRHLKLGELEIAHGSVIDGIEHTKNALALYKKYVGVCHDSVYAATSDAWVALCRSMNNYWDAYQSEKNLDYLHQITCIGNNLVSIYQSVLQLIPNKSSKVSFKDRLKEIAELMIMAQMALVENGEEIDNEALFAFIDKIKVYDLRWKLTGDANAMIGYGISEEIKEQIDGYKHSIAVLEGLLAISTDSTERHVYHKSLTTTKLELTALNARLKNQHPAFYQFLYSMPAFEHQALNELAGMKKAILSYFVGNEQAFVKTYFKGSYKLHSLGKADSLRTLIDNFHKSIKEKHASQSQQIGQELYNRLIPKPYRDIEELIIIPDERIYLVPFDALVLENSSYALEKHQFTSSFSIAYLLQNQLKPATKYDYEYLGIALNFSGNPDKLLPFLQNAEKEVQGAAKHFNAQRLLLKLQASESDFATNAKGSRIIHLATHALANQQNPLLSRLVLGPDEQNDGNLYLYELLNMSIPSELVILSACNTGSGQVTSTDGLTSLGYGFAYAGSQNSIISLWSSPDASTASIIENYTKYIAKGMAYDKALRQAKLDYLKEADPLAAQPFYWGGLVFTGVPDAAIQQSNTTWIWVLATGLLLTIGLLWSIKRRKT